MALRLSSTIEWVILLCSACMLPYDSPLKGDSSIYSLWSFKSVKESFKINYWNFKSLTKFYPKHRISMTRGKLYMYCNSGRISKTDQLGQISHFVEPLYYYYAFPSLQASAKFICTCQYMMHPTFVKAKDLASTIDTCLSAQVIWRCIILNFKA